MKNIKILMLIVVGLTILCCTNTDAKEKGKNNKTTIEKSTDLNYSVVFPNDKVNRIDIIIDKTQWNKMAVDLKSNISTSDRIPQKQGNNSDLKTGSPNQNDSENSSHRRIHEGPPRGGFNRQSGMENDSIHMPGRERRMGPPPGGMPGGSQVTPIWVYCDVLFNNEKWSKVGIRYKGNSSLRSAVQQGIKKLSLKLDFDQFEDDFPEIKNQRFYGFQQLNLKNNYDDKSFIREKVASDLFADFGLITSKTSFYKLYIDFGEGPQYFGLYTMVEEVDDTVIESGFSSDKGNLYKPEGRAATFAKGSFRATDMNKKTNKKSKDYSDIEELSTVLNSSLRLENYELWKSEFTEIFDVPVFLKWLAVNTVIQNWDTYGSSIHNFYLYNNPESNKLAWIPWDNNEAFQKGKMRGAPSLSFNEIDENWPLIRYILNDDDWNEEYKKNVIEFSEEFFTPERMDKIYSNYQQLLSDCVTGKQGEKSNYTFLENESDFNEAIDFLKQHVIERKTAVEQFASK